MTHSLLNWYISIFGSVLLLFSGGLAGIIGRNLGIKILKKGFVLTIFGSVFLVIMAVFGPPPKSQIEKEPVNTIMVNPQPRYVNSVHEKFALGVYEAIAKHGNRPSKDHVAYEGNWILQENQIKLLIKDRKEALQ